jgi:UDP-glucose 4-epimerase
LGEVVVTGGAGFIGSAVVNLLLEKGYTVRVVDDLSTGDLRNLPDHPRLRFVKHDVTVAEGLDNVLNGAETIIHMAAVASVPECESNPMKAFKVNVRGLENIIKLGVKNSVKKIVFTSSAAVYGDVEEPVSEEAPPKPFSVYGHTKLLGETLLENSGVPSLVFRIFNAYGRTGAGVGTYGIVDRFLKNLKEGKPLEIYGDGKNVRDFIHVRDVANAVALSVEKDVDGFNVFNLGTGRATTIYELADLVLKLSSQGRVVMHPPRQGDIKYSVADISKAARELGFKPTVTLDDYIKQQLSR